MSKKLSARQWLGIILIGLFGQFAWTIENMYFNVFLYNTCLLYTSPSPRDRQKSRMPSSA